MLTLPLPAILGAVGLAATLTFVGHWALQLRTRNASGVDVAWAGGVGSAAVFAALVSPGSPERRALLGGAAALWAFRLAVHLARRSSGRPEDGRYAELRRVWGPAAPRRFLGLYVAQALLVVVFTLPIAAALRAREALGPLDVAAASWLVLCTLGEAAADGQLERFRRDPRHRGTTCRVGLWRYSRHPNYFFEWLGWWAWPLASVGTGTLLPALLGPALMTVFLLRVTGIPVTERQAARSRGDYEDYRATTSAFVPWAPRRREPSR